MGRFLAIQILEGDDTLCAEVLSIIFRGKTTVFIRPLTELKIPPKHEKKRKLLLLDDSDTEDSLPDITFDSNEKLDVSLKADQNDTEPKSTVDVSPFEASYEAYRHLLKDEITVYDSEEDEPPNLDNSYYGNDITEPEVNSEVRDVKEILNEIARSELKPESKAISRFNVKRNNVLAGALRGLMKATFRPENPINVTFVCSSFREEAIDAGGPKREFLNLLLKEFVSSNVFIGSEFEKYINVNTDAKAQNMHFYAGVAIALSMVHGGPGPSCLSEITYLSLISDIKNLCPTVEDIQDYELKDKIYQMKNCQNLSDLKKMANDLQIYLEMM